MEKHFAQIALGKAIGCFRRDQAALDGAMPHAVVVDAATVILHFDVDVISTMIGAQTDFSELRLPSGYAILGGFDAVCDRVAHQVKQRIGNLLDEAFVNSVLLPPKSSSTCLSADFAASRTARDR